MTQDFTTTFSGLLNMHLEAFDQLAQCPAAMQWTPELYRRATN
jgi:hypothetical protein